MRWSCELLWLDILQRYRKHIVILHIIFKNTTTLYEKNTNILYIEVHLGMELLWQQMCHAHAAGTYSAAMAGKAQKGSVAPDDGFATR